jgi:hypothetical protein
VLAAGERRQIAATLLVGAEERQAELADAAGDAERDAEGAVEAEEL